MKSFILAATAVAALAGCATSTVAPNAEQTPATDLVYRTGSHIPIRDKTPMTKEEKEKHYWSRRGVDLGTFCRKLNLIVNELDMREECAVSQL